MGDAWVNGVSIVLVALIGAYATRGAVRAGRKAGNEQKSIEDGVISTQSFVDIVGTYEGRLHDLERRQRKTDEDLAKTKQDLDGMHDWKRAAIRYIRALRQHSVHHLPGEVLPEPPPELLLDLAD